MSIEIRDATPDDLEAIARGNIAMALETEHKTLAPDVVRAGVAAALADSGKGRYFVAESAGHVVGQLMITYEWSDWRNGNFWWIQSVYVLPEARQQGVFRALYRYVEQRARATPATCGLRLYVERENARAQHTYLACGMVDAGYRMMEADYSGAIRRAEA